MPALLTAMHSDLDVVRAVAELLIADGGEVRCYLEEDDYELRNLGCKIAVGSLLDPANLQGALSNVHTFMPLMPDALSFEEADLGYLRDFGEVAAEAARYSSIEQTILVLTGLGTGGSTLATVTSAILEAFKPLNPLCVLRPGIIWGAERPLKIHPAKVLGDEAIEGVHMTDLASDVASADDREGTHGSWNITGVTVSDAGPPTADTSLQAKLRALTPSLSELRQMPRFSAGALAD